ncbi:MAG: uroporphyrinogen-III synthase [Roseomonas sp.]|nr:uroporphyrinogen-III synthase [Roseomonas sp.]MCA3430916.1 uroporphyrinogen-III synthase [Roseomonas sp.]MCA3435337.1 uroporphyrinogen-III synthase [Roseomonas sp.]
MPRQAARASRAILITRPEPGAAESARAVAALGWEAVLAPALTLTALPLKAPGNCQAIIVTSRAAARALPPAVLPVIAVGEATATEARARGFADVRAAAGDAQALAALIGATLKPEAGTLCLAVGEGYALDLASALRAKGFRVLRRVVYAARPSAALPAEALQAIRERRIHAALFTSPRSALVAMRLLADAGLHKAAQNIIAIALSPRIAAALAALPWAEIRTASRPDHAALLACLGPADVLKAPA